MKTCLVLFVILLAFGAMGANAVVGDSPHEELVTPTSAPMAASHHSVKTLDENRNPVLSSVTYPTNWEQGESVEIETQGTYSTINILDYYHCDYYSGYFQSFYWNLVEDLYDESDFAWGSSLHTDYVYAQESVRWELYCGSAGTIYYKINVTAYLSGVKEANNYLIGSYYVGSSYLDIVGALHFRIDTQYLGAGANYHKTNLTLETRVGNIDINNTLNGDHSGDIDEFRYCLYSLYFVPDSINSNQRCEYRYVGVDYKQFKLELQTYDHNTNFTIYAPKHWDTPIIDPLAPIETVGNNYRVYNTLPLDYEILFISNSSKQYMATTDKTTDHLQDIGFEGSYQNDWTPTPGYEPDELALNTTIVYEGAFSLRTEDGDSGTEAFWTILDYGYYYFSFAYYVESFSGTSFDFEFRNDNTWEITVLDTDITDRWQHCFVYAHINDYYPSPDRNIELVWRSSQGVIFIDDFKVWEANPSASTSSNYPSTTFSSTLISWDGYLNPTVSNEEINFDLRDRTADTSIDTTTVVTNVNGYAEWTWGGRLEQKEYEIRAWCYESWWGTPWTKTELWDLSNWNGVSEETTDEYVQIEVSADRPYFNPSGAWDLSNVDYLYEECYWNSSSSYTTYLDSFVASESGISVNTWFTAIHRIPEDFSGSDDWSDITYVGLSWSASSQLHRTRDIHVIQSQKSYFTPQVAGTASSPELHYAETHGWMESVNNTLGYRIENDNELLGYYDDLRTFPLNVTPGAHNVNATPYIDYWNVTAYVNGSSILHDYTIYNTTQGILDEINNVNSSLYNLVESVNSSLFSYIDTINSIIYNFVNSVNSSLFSYIGNVNASLSDQIDTINTTVYENCTITDNWNQTAHKELNATIWSVLLNILATPNEYVGMTWIDWVFLMANWLLKEGGFPILIMIGGIFLLLFAILYLTWRSFS